MDVVRTVVAVLGFVNKLVPIIEKHKGRTNSLARGLRSMKREFETMKSECEEKLHMQPAGMHLQVQELAYDIEDFIQDILVSGPSSAFIRTATGTDPRPDYIQSIEDFKQRIKSINEQLMRLGSRSATPPTSPSSARSPGISYAAEMDPVGIAKPKEKIIDLLSRSDGPMRVISILGRSGLGKTALSRAIYEDEEVTRDFHYTSWVVASDHSPMEILNKIHQALHLPPSHRSIFEASQHLLSSSLSKIVQGLHLAHGRTPQALQHFSKCILQNILQGLNLARAYGSSSQALQYFSKNKRYLLFIDDVQREGIIWDDIEDAFRGNNMGSRIILTTRIPSIAAANSSGSYMYKMECLGDKESKELFWRKANIRCPEPPPSLAIGSKDIFLKCGGLPQALISAGKFLSKKGLNLSRIHCEDVGKGLGGYLVGNEEDFEDIKKALVQCYESLPGYDDMNRLLYVSMYPMGHQIKSKNLVRKLKAEALVAENGGLSLDEFIDQNQSMVEKVLFRDDSKVADERCKVHNILLGFAIETTVSRNFVSLIQEGNLQRSDCGSVRRLTIQSKDIGIHSTQEVELSSLRSLTIFNNGVMDFGSCRMMRVLDLEGCPDAVSEKERKKDVIGAICELVFLKYLSLRKTRIAALPIEVKNLKCLQMLDIRETGVDNLPIQVIFLPQLEFLFGKFELPPLDPKKRENIKFLQENSKLKTLAGIVINGTRDFQTIILHAARLEKIKIWFKDDASGKLTTQNILVGTLVSSLQARFKKLESVSIDFNGLRQDFLGSVQAPCTITSIKLRGKLEKLPQAGVLSQLINLRKLHLFSTGLSIKVLSVLQYLQYLEYLKLADDRIRSWDDPMTQTPTTFVINAEGFPSLHVLCFQAPNLPKVQFKKGSMASLRSLQLLCPGADAQVEAISHLASLNEVILHHSVDDKAWKAAAEKHINRPHVKKQPIPIPPTQVS